ncbi:HEAT repeat domain-containing protein [Parapedobacter indicus]|uniref:HEAT repeat-containing protein n=1 Tax=Parapedobacter indicus TaxID=1477437 RepID=A0A1I3K5T7_9SPHI|nr:HEAT repeat domain-containing protein [Parapedobacter indicus]PPL01721.1 HEAT repeat protein [Parapedobacter indicus]SFI67847.1 HEAT repeat-containing protein [Parapedobacter indicus]
MKDDLKDFVNKHREEFDHLSPSADVFKRLHMQLKADGGHTDKNESVFKRLPYLPWLAAASLLIATLSAYWLLNTDRPTADRLLASNKPLTGEQHQPTGHTPASTSTNPIETEAAAPLSPPVNAIANAGKNPQRRAKAVPTAPQTPSFATRLRDSSSASTRLAAILEIEQNRQLDNRSLTMLAQTLNRDGNTNVRLAALDVLSQHLDQPDIVDVFQKSLMEQDDPLVQLGIIKIVSQLDDGAIDRTLFSLAEDPYTFRAVRDEAYAVLLKKNKL